MPIVTLVIDIVIALRNNRHEEAHHGSYNRRYLHKGRVVRRCLS
jgi:hypothetical protein